MSDANNYESGLWRLLEDKKLADLAQFHRRGFFDEVPLYTRERDIDFLPDDKSEANEILLRFALKYLKSIIAYEQHRTGYFAAITVWSFSVAPLVPNLFVWCGAVRPLEEKLALAVAASPFGKQMNKLVPRLRLGDQYKVLEDTSTVADATRVFIAPERPPYQGFVTLDHFQQSASASK